MANVNVNTDDEEVLAYLQVIRRAFFSGNLQKNVTLELPSSPGFPCFNFRISLLWFWCLKCVSP